MKNLIFISLLLFISCTPREELDSSSVVINEIKNIDSLDHWLYQTYTLPYNIDVKYRWDANATGLSNTTTPPIREQVKPTMEAIEKLWLEVYTKVAGKDFMKTYAPREIYLYGSKNLDREGNEQIKSKHSPIQMPLFRVNEFNPKDSVAVAIVTRMAHHQFAKTLIQKKPIDREAFYQLNFYNYNDNWGRGSAQLYDLATRASDFGYYSMLAARGSVEEDFAETVSALLCNTNIEVDDMIYNYAGYADPYTPNDAERAKNAIKTLNAKKEFVIKYFKDNFNINFNRLQFESNVQIKTYLKK